MENRLKELENKNLGNKNTARIIAQLAVGQDGLNVKTSSDGTKYADVPLSLYAGKDDEGKIKSNVIFTRVFESDFAKIEALANKSYTQKQNVRVEGKFVDKSFQDANGDWKTQTTFVAKKWDLTGEKQCATFDIKGRLKIDPIIKDVENTLEDGTFTSYKQAYAPILVEHGIKQEDGSYKKFYEELSFNTFGSNAEQLQQAKQDDQLGISGQIGFTENGKVKIRANKIFFGLNKDEFKEMVSITQENKQLKELSPEDEKAVEEFLNQDNDQDQDIELN